MLGFQYRNILPQAKEVYAFARPPRNAWSHVCLCGCVGVWVWGCGCVWVWVWVGVLCVCVCACVCVCMCVCVCVCVCVFMCLCPGSVNSSELLLVLISRFKAMKGRWVSHTNTYTQEGTIRVNDSDIFQ